MGYEVKSSPDWWVRAFSVVAVLLLVVLLAVVATRGVVVVRGSDQVVTYFSTVYATTTVTRDVTSTSVSVTSSVQSPLLLSENSVLVPPITATQWLSYNFTLGQFYNHVILQYTVFSSSGNATNLVVTYTVGKANGNIGGTGSVDLQPFLTTGDHYVISFATNSPDRTYLTFSITGS